MRFLHTADWHLGRNFFGVSLIEEQAHVLDQFINVAAGSRVDAVLLAGDIFDRSAPPADAVALLDQTLTRLVLDHGIRVVMIAGNHDSGERLAFGSKLLSARGLHVAGTEPCVVPFDDAHGGLDVIAIPFAEPAAVAARLGDPSISDHDSAIRADAEAALATASAAASPPARKSKNATRRRIAVAHAFVTGGSSSESERPLVMGNAALVASSCFDAFGYAALGHLHRPQSAGRAEVRYSGSLMKYSFDEAAHRKSVSLVEMDSAGACTVEEVALSPRRNVRVLEGTLDELRRAAEADSSRDDYVMARLTDRGAILDSIGKMRMLYPNCLRVDHAAFFSNESRENAERADLRRHSETELFDAFFLDVTGASPADDERLAFADALAAVRRSAAES